jgi:hypothetical protein
MTQTKYNKYFLENPWGIQLPFSDSDAPKYIGIGQKATGMSPLHRSYVRYINPSG